MNMKSTSEASQNHTNQLLFENHPHNTYGIIYLIPNKILSLITEQMNRKCLRHDAL
uniref:Uncharacterized protein n=1 Tax=Anguilla anguilla TaxID=7936 RepID=A0A0E9WD94_ANGAN